MSKTLKAAAKLIRERGWWDGHTNQGITLCAQNAISAVCIFNTDDLYADTMAELASRITPGYEKLYGSYTVVTQYNDSLSDPAPLLELMERD